MALLLKTLRGHTGDVNSVAILGPDRIVSGSLDKTVKIWSTNGTLLKTLRGHKKGIYSVASYQVPTESLVDLRTRR